MKFKISRTSTYCNQPCIEAVKEKCISIDERTVNSPDKLNFKYDRENWFTEGTNHRIEDGHIKRDIEDEDWFIEVNTLEDLIEFQEKYGDIIIQKSWDNDTIKEIEIYDDYRE